MMNIWGLSAEQTAAFMGNIYHEGVYSSLNAQDSMGWDGVFNPEYMDVFSLTDSTGWGILQWTDEKRKAGLLEFASGEGTDIGNMDTQLKYLFHEITTVDPDYFKWEEIRNSNDVDHLTWLVMVYVVGPSDQNLEDRQIEAWKQLAIITK